MKFDYSKRNKETRNEDKKKEEILDVVSDDIKKDNELENNIVEEVVEEAVVNKEDILSEEEVNELKENDVISVKSDNVIIENTKEDILEEKKDLTRPCSIINCELLNARKEPNSNSEILFVLNKKKGLPMYILEEVEEFYKIAVLENNERKEIYCMKNFIQELK